MSITYIDNHPSIKSNIPITSEEGFMKKLCMILTLALILSIMVGCQEQEAMAELEALKAQAEVEAQNKDIVRRYFEMVDRGDVESLYKFVDENFEPDYIDHSASYEEHGIEGVRKHLEFAFNTFGDMKHELKVMIAEGDLVSIRGTFQATHKGDFFGVQPTGTKLTCPMLYMFRVKEGKLQECWIDSDSLLSMAMQLGLELRPKEEP
jgi:predicted ester cyclase